MDTETALATAILILKDPTPEDERKKPKNIGMIQAHGERFNMSFGHPFEYPSQDLDSPMLMGKFNQENVINAHKNIPSSNVMKKKEEKKVK